MLILSDGDDVRDLVPQDERIRHIHIEGSARIGEKRNIGAEYSDGDLVAHFDDDDWSAPGRLVDQIARLQDSGKAVTGYRSMCFIGFGETWFYSGKPDYALGTSLCYRRDWWLKNRFPAVQIAEDAEFVENAVRQDQFISADAGELMYATTHDQNTSPRLMRRTDRWKRIA